MSSVTEPATRRRPFNDLLPATMLLAVISTSFIILCHLVVVLWLSFSDGTPGTGLTYTAANYTEVFSDQRTYTVLIDTFAFAFVSLAVALGIGIPIAWIAERTDFRAKTLLFTLMAIGLLIPGFAVAMGWLFLLHPRIGLLNQLFQIVFGIPSPFSITSILGMGWVQGLNLAPLAFIMTAAVFRSMDPSMEEAAEVHGASPLRVLRSDYRAARLARHHGGVDLRVHDRVRSLRRAGHHRLGQSHLHVLDLSLFVAQSAGRAAALWPCRRTLNYRARDRSAGELVVRHHGAALAPICSRDRQGLSAQAQAARPPRDRRMVLHRRLPAAQQDHAAHAARLRVRAAILPAPERHGLLDHVACPLRDAAVGAGVPGGRQYAHPRRFRADGHSGAQPCVLLDRPALTHPGPRRLRFHRLPAACGAQHHLWRRRAAAAAVSAAAGCCRCTAQFGSC